jgi:hypothetical protein
MDDFTAEMLASGQDNDSRAGPQVDNEPSTPPHWSGLRGGFAAIREKASLQDRLVER